VRIRVLAGDLARVRVVRSGDTEPDRSYAVSRTDWPPAPFETAESEESVEVRAAALRVSVRKADAAITVTSSRGTPLLEAARIEWAGEGFSLAWTQPEDRRVYGCGEQAGSLERRGHRMVFWNFDHYEFDVDATPLYQSIPFCMTLDGGEANGILLDNTFRQEWDLGAPGAAGASISVDGGALDLYLFGSGTPRDVVERYTDLTGRMPLPPLWALGYQQSRYSYYPESEVRGIAAGFRDRNIPCDVLYLDIHYMEDYKCFTWDRERFPDPKRMLADLRDQGFRVIAIINPGVKVTDGYPVYEELKGAGFHLRNADGLPFIGPVWPGQCLFPDFTDPECRKWWGSLYAPLLEDGVAAFWNDMNEPAVFETGSKTAPLESLHDGDGYPGDHRRYHNVYGMLMARATDEGLRRLQPDERPFVLARAGYAGSQRHAATWTGDNIASWDHLRISIPMVLNLGLSGQAISGPDIGGFVGDPTPELFARWLQFGALMPFCRVHSARSTHDVIHAEGAAPQEPWSYGTEWEEINRASIRLRYELLPYLYTVFEEMTRTGAPVMRPLCYEYPDDPACAGVDDQFLVGRDILVAPIVHEGATSRRVYLPAGAWCDYRTGERFHGPSEIEVIAPIDRLPLFARGGAAIPTQEPVAHTDESPRQAIRWRVIVDDGKAEGWLYEDDGHTMAYRDRVYLRTRLTYVERPEGDGILRVETEGDYRSPRPEAEYEAV